MKHIIILLSILLLSSPVIGDNHKGETLYPIIDETGLFVDKNSVKWLRFGNDKLFKYVGELKQLLKQLLNECDVKKSDFVVEVFESQC